MRARKSTGRRQHGCERLGKMDSYNHLISWHLPRVVSFDASNCHDFSMLKYPGNEKPRYIRLVAMELSAAADLFVVGLPG